MSTVLQHKRSSTTGLAPTTSQLAYGELAINTHDGTLFLKKDDGSGAVIVTLREVTEDNLAVDTTGFLNSYSSVLSDVLSDFDAAIDDAGGKIYLSSIGDLADVDTTTNAPITGQFLKWDGTNWVPAAGGGGGGVTYAEQSVVSDSFTGNGSTTAYTVSLIPDSEDHVMVMLNGIVQDPSTYSLLGTTLTFVTAPASGDNIELRTFSGFSTSVALNNYKSYRFTIAGNTSTITGLDDNGDTLSYTGGRIELYVNGVRLSNGVDYTATNGTSVSFNQTIFAGSVVEIVSLATAALLNEALQIQTESIALSTTTANQPVASFAKADYRTAKFLVQMSHASAGYHATEVLVLHNGTTVFTTEYATIFTNSSLGTVDAIVNGSNIELVVTPANTNTTVKTKRISVEA